MIMVIYAAIVFIAVFLCPQAPTVETPGCAGNLPGSKVSLLFPWPLLASKTKPKKHDLFPNNHLIVNFTTALSYQHQHKQGLHVGLLGGKNTTPVLLTLSLRHDGLAWSPLSGPPCSTLADIVVVCLQMNGVSCLPASLNAPFVLSQDPW